MVFFELEIEKTLNDVNNLNVERRIPNDIYSNDSSVIII